MMITIPKVAIVSVTALVAVASPLTDQSHFTGSHQERNVPVHLGVMSQCPDAILCETVFDTVLQKVGSKVDLEFVYIAQPDSTDSDYGLVCKHGPAECAGNIQQLCLAKHASFAQLWSFVQCSNFQGRNKVGTPLVASKCAKAAEFEWEGPLADCVGEDFSGRTSEGIELLKNSASKAKDLKIVKSCTMIINHKQVCVRDETWKECEGGHTPNDFVRQINEEYNRINELQ